MSSKNSLYPRSQAIRLLTRVLSDHAPLDDAAFEEASRDLPPEARGWLQEICLGTLRWKGRLDLILDSIALKKKPSGWLRKALLVAAYQLVVQERTSPGAIVSETVDEVRGREGAAPSKFANALLRKVALHAAEWRTLALAPKASVEESARWASMPTWLWSEIATQRGRDWAEAFAQSALDRPEMWVRARRADWRPEWALPGPVEFSWRAQTGGSIPHKSGFVEGEFVVQDISSQLLIHEITQCVRAESPNAMTVLDLCASPGGKSVGLAWNGFQVFATDRDERLSLLRGTVSRAQARIEVIERGNVASLPEVDLAWVDAPCTGSGIIRRHPDVRWLREPKDVQALVKTQKELVIEAWEKVRPGGWLAYSVCSILKQEGPDLIDQAGLKTHVRREWLLAPHLAPGGDGFWAALLKKPGA
jgi:16S rRNA (cytosine967-C5)-methyltransferase